MNVTGRFHAITWMLRDNLIYWQRGLYLKELSVKNQLKKNNKIFWRHNKLMTKQLTNEQRIEIICLP